MFNNFDMGNENEKLDRIRRYMLRCIGLLSLYKVRLVKKNASTERLSLQDLFYAEQLNW